MFDFSLAWLRREMRSKDDGRTLDKMTSLGDNPITPFPSGRLPVCCFSRHFVPGYLHSVPSGHSQRLAELTGCVRVEPNHYVPGVAEGPGELETASGLGVASGVDFVSGLGVVSGVAEPSGL
jgi:hypothetical protein